MHKLFRSLAAFAAISFATAPAATAGELVIRIADGRATVIARDVPVNQILAEWARVGNTRVVNGEQLVGGPVTLELIDLPEKQALDILLRSAAGYMTAPRAEPVAGASLYDRVVILATSHAPATPPPVPQQPFGRPVVQPVFPQPQTDDQGNEVGEQGPVPPPGMMPPPPAGPYPPPAGQYPTGQYPTGPYPMPAGQYPMPAGQYPPPAGMPMTPGDTPVQQQPITSPRPGMLPPQPQPTPIMPYSPSGPVPPPPTP